MKSFNLNYALCTLLLSFPSINAIKNCPFLGPDFPAPRNLSSSPSVVAALANLTNVIDRRISTERFASNNTSFSVDIFSSKTNTSLFQYHHTSASLLQSNGTHKVDGDSIYRIASVSKLLSVYTWLIEDGDKNFHQPITNYIPELRALRNQSDSKNGADVVDWESVTVQSLASQMAGIAREYTGDLLTRLPSLEGTGIPDINTTDIQLCGIPGDCDRKEFFRTLTTQRHPVFPTTSTPIYSNVAFQLLGYALESIKSETFETMVNRSIVDKLGLTGTSYASPVSQSRGVIPGDVFDTTWSINFADFNPTGGMYSTPNDLAILGRSILKSEILSPALTRRWLKPLSHSESLTFSLGAPWEIQRYVLPGPQKKVIDMYTKQGDIGSYHSTFALVPDWDIGYSVIHADSPTQPTDVRSAISSLIDRILLPAFVDAAREEAHTNYAGTYHAAEPNLNSSLTVTTSSGQLGLQVTSFISNGTDMFFVLSASRGFPAANLSITLYPTGLTNFDSAQGGRKEAWRAVLENTYQPSELDEGYYGCATWAVADSLLVGGIAADEIAFVVGEDGVASGVESRALRLFMEKQ